MEKETARFPILWPPSRGRDTLLFASKQIFLAEKKTRGFPNAPQYVRAEKPPSRGRDTSPLALKQAYFAERKTLRTFQNPFPLL